MRKKNVLKNSSLFLFLPTKKCKEKLMKISEINLVPVKPKNGLVGFASFVLGNCLYVSSVAIYTRPNGGYRCIYPTKQIGSKNINIFHPINRVFATAIEEKVTKEFEKLMGECNVKNQTNQFL